MKTVICIFIISQYFQALNGQYLDVTIDQGTVRGYKHPTLDLYAFYGIPYATAPSGRDKFKAPGPAPKWEGTFDATNSFILCPQNIIAVSEREDCLVINVFVPQSNITSKPVLASVHGGAFSMGWSTEGVPLTFVEKDIVVVSFNYRLGAHGFLCLNTENIPGNAGLKDQIAALKWVKNNIKAFGGDPDDVTIYGGSAGAASVELLMLSPAANNLFKKVIMDGGSGITTWAFNTHGVEYAQQIAALNNASNVDDITELENFYLNKTYSELLSLELPSFHIIHFTPCLENDRGNENPVFIKSPREILESGNYTKLPLLTGYSDAEGLLYYFAWESIMSQMNKDFSELLPPNFISHSVMNASKAADTLKSFYFGENDINYNYIKNYTDYFTDSYYSYWIIESAKLHAVHSPVYLYEFNYVSSTQPVRPDLGAAHCTPSALVGNYITESLNENDLIVQRRLLSTWANFVKSGQPVPQGQPDYWEALDVNRINYLEFGLTVQNKNFPLSERLQVWDQVMNEDVDIDDDNDPNAATKIESMLKIFLLNFIILISQYMNV